ncbi:acyltransferase [Geminocystis sp. CENA526]|uniref:acyltransferase n=1 Tax=Geminocystis sp. CENA526 TaxID=1355871 RepID=UPI003D6FDC4C
MIKTGLSLINKVSEGIKSRWRNYYYQSLGVKLHGYIWMRDIEIPRNFTDIEIESPCALDRGVTLLCSGEPVDKPRIYIGSHTYINRNTFIDATESIIIGEYCGIGPNCYITDHDHGYDAELPPLKQPMVSKPTKIGNNVWIGANVTILKGVSIGDRTIVGAGSVVTKSLPENVIAVGNPAQIIKYRT